MSKFAAFDDRAKLVLDGRIEDQFSTLLKPPAVYNECVTAFRVMTYDDTAMNKIYHPLLALIASATDRELAKYVEHLTWNMRSIP